MLIRSNGAHSKLIWRWLKGDAPVAELGDPTTSTGYALCVYDSTALVPALAIRIDVAAAGTCGGAPCWAALGGVTPKGFRFDDGTGAQGGMQKLRLKGGRPGHDKLLIKAGGAALALPTPASATQLFAQQQDVTVQVVNDDGNCWDATYSPSAVLTNRADFYKAKR